MEYSAKKITEAFDIYTALTQRGELLRAECGEFFFDRELEELVKLFADRVQCTLLHDGMKLYLIPCAVDSPLHISNDALKKEYMPARALNMDIYLMYLAIIVLFGCFYDSYNSNEPADFVSMDKWLEEMNGRIDALNSVDEEALKTAEREFDFNWQQLVEKWQALDDLKETVKKQDGRTNSRLGALNNAKLFLEKQSLVEDIGEFQLQLTDKAKTIIGNYYMDENYNKGIMDYLYKLDHAPVAKEEK